MIQPIHIALSGKMASGKSLIATYLVKQHGFVELVFAARLKEIAADMFNLDVARKDEKGRMLLQQLAHHMREIDPMVWIRYIIRKIPLEGNVVISDVRYPNEFNTLHNLGFTMVRMFMSKSMQLILVRKLYPDIPPILMYDYSETALDGFEFDAIIDNDLGVPLALLHKQVDALISSIVRVK